MLQKQLLSLFVLVFLSSVSWANQSDRELQVEEAVDQFVRVLRQRDGNPRKALGNLLDESKRDQLAEAIDKARQLAKGGRVASVHIRKKSGKVFFELENQELTVDFEFTSDMPIRFSSVTTKLAALQNPDANPITWDNLDQSMQQASKDGFEGAVLLSRDEKIVFNKGYGYANRNEEVKNGPNTIFAIGSAPIDFTHAGILLLVDRGKVTLDDPISNYFDNVPQDKQPITIKHLMTGRSGLRDFHDIPTDKNPDHTWIDRDEAVRRIMKQKLLFVPGKGRRHSHSAWGLLAAVIEIAGKQTYPEFTREHLFGPAEMQDTGFFGDPVDKRRIAVGYGSQESSQPNSPPHWGPTSWLIMGSGGQISTLADMYRWEVAMRNGSILSADSAKIYLGDGDGVSQDGDMFGFEFMHSKNPDQIFMIISNAVNTRQDRKDFDQLGRRLQRLVRKR